MVYDLGENDVPFRALGDQGVDERWGGLEGRVAIVDARPE
jgi:hypothetical protein